MKSFIVSKHQLVSVWIVEALTAFLVLIGLHQYLIQVIRVDVIISLFFVIIALVAMIILRTYFSLVVFGGIR